VLVDTIEILEDSAAAAIEAARASHTPSRDEAQRLGVRGLGLNDLTLEFSIAKSTKKPTSLGSRGTIAKTKGWHHHECIEQGASARFVQDLFREIYRQDFTGMMELCSDFVYHLPLVGVLKDEALKQLFASMLAAFPDHQRTIDDQFTDDVHVVTRWTTTGTHQGEFMGIAPTQAGYRHWHMHSSHPGWKDR
jgi:hypothetical protein